MGPVTLCRKKDQPGGLFRLVRQKIIIIRIIINETMKESPYKWFTSKLQTNKVEGKRCYLSHQVALQYQFQIYGIDKLANEHISPYFDKGEIDIEKFSLAIQV